MSVAADLIVPLLLTLFVVLATTPLVLALQRRGIPPRVARLGVYAALVVLGLAALANLLLVLHEVSQNLPGYEDAHSHRLGDMQTALADAGITLPGGSRLSVVVIGFVTDLAQQLVDVVSIA